MRQRLQRKKLSECARENYRCIYIYIDMERERERERAVFVASATAPATDKKAREFPEILSEGLIAIIIVEWVSAFHSLYASHLSAEQARASSGGLAWPARQIHIYLPHAAYIVQGLEQERVENVPERVAVTTIPLLPFGEQAEGNLEKEEKAPRRRTISGIQPVASGTRESTTGF